MKRALTISMVEMLTAHLVGPCDIDVAGSGRGKAQSALMARKFIKLTKPRRAPATAITLNGESAVAHRLLDIGLAEALESAEFWQNIGRIESPSTQPVVTTTPAPSRPSRRMASLPADGSPTAIKPCRGRERVSVQGEA